MRPTIKKIFNSWKILSAILTILLGVIAYSSAQEHISFSKVENLKNQKSLVVYVSQISRDDLELASIQYRGKSTQLHYEHEKLLNLYGYDLFGQYLLGHSSDYENDLEKLKLLAIAFTDSAEEWYAENSKNLEEREAKMLDARSSILAHLDAMIQTNIGYDYDKFMVQQGLIYTALLLALFIFAWYAKRLSSVYRDIHSLYAIDADGDAYTIMTDEVETISKRMSRKPQSSDNPAMIDPITEINNYKGMLYAFANKKSMKESNYIAVCVFEIDNFKALDKQYPKTFTQSVLKKIAFMISLYEQHTDVIARTDYSQFAVIFSRHTKDQAMHDCELIRKSVEETAFKVPKGASINLTLSGGFVQKLSNTTLDETIQEAKEVLKKAQESGSNRTVEKIEVV